VRGVCPVSRVAWTVVLTSTKLERRGLSLCSADRDTIEVLDSPYTLQFVCT
jgi:hypothetical protein